jgi:hypothetical protein
MLCVAREDEPERHVVTVLRVHESAFAPAPGPEGARTHLDVGRYHPPTFVYAYLRQLRELWRRDPAAFLDLIAQATGGGDVTLVDDFGDVDHAPRRILARALVAVVRRQKAERARERHRRARAEAAVSARPRA